MRYFVVNIKTGNVEGYETGYKTLKAAKNSIYRFEFLERATKYVREVLKIPPGDLFASKVDEWFSDRYKIVSGTKLIIKTDEGYFEKDI